MSKDVFDEYGNYKYPDYSNSQYTHYTTATGGTMMGMTIDNLELFAKGLDCVGDTEHAKDIRQAIDTMRKYQKIEQIVKEWEFDHESMVDSMEKISGVVEDGNVD